MTLQDQIVIRLKQNSDTAANQQKQSLEELSAVHSELATAQEELQTKQLAADALKLQLADSYQELSTLQQCLHALHAEVKTAQQAHAHIQTQLMHAQTELEPRQMQLRKLEGDRDRMRQGAVVDQQIMIDVVKCMEGSQPSELVKAASSSQRVGQKASAANGLDTEEPKQQFQVGS